MAKLPLFEAASRAREEAIKAAGIDLNTEKGREEFNYRCQFDADFITTIAAAFNATLQGFGYRDLEGTPYNGTAPTEPPPEVSEVERQLAQSVEQLNEALNRSFDQELSPEAVTFEPPEPWELAIEPWQLDIERDLDKDVLTIAELGAALQRTLAKNEAQELIGERPIRAAGWLKCLIEEAWEVIARFGITPLPPKSGADTDNPRHALNVLLAWCNEHATETPIADTNTEASAASPPVLIQNDRTDAGTNPKPFLFHKDGAHYRVRFTDQDGRAEEGTIDATLDGTNYLKEFLERPYKHLDPIEMTERLKEDGGVGGSIKRWESLADARNNGDIILEYLNQYRTKGRMLEELNGESDQASNSEEINRLWSEQDDILDNLKAMTESKDDASTEEILTAAWAIAKNRRLPQGNSPQKLAKKRIREALDRILEKCEDTSPTGWNLPRFAKHIRQAMPPRAPLSYQPEAPAPDWNFF